MLLVPLIHDHYHMFHGITQLHSYSSQIGKFPVKSTKKISAYLHFIIMRPKHYMIWQSQTTKQPKSNILRTTYFLHFDIKGLSNLAPRSGQIMLQGSPSSICQSTISIKLSYWQSMESLHQNVLFAHSITTFLLYSNHQPQLLVGFIMPKCCCNHFESSPFISPLPIISNKCFPF